MDGNYTHGKDRLVFASAACALGEYFFLYRVKKSIVLLYFFNNEGNTTLK